jgi:hypothetical protein
MPTPKKFLSKAQRQLSTGYKQYERGFFKTPSSMREKAPDPPSALFSKGDIGRGLTAPSSQVKKTPKEGSRKFVGPRSQRGLLAEEVLATDPTTYREYVPKQSPKNRQAWKKGKPEKRDPENVPSALIRANQAGNDVNSSTSRFSQSQNRQRFIEITNAVNKLPPDLRKKLRDALKSGVRNSKIPF